MAPNASVQQPDIDVDISDYVVADQDSDGDERFGAFVQSRAAVTKQLPPVAEKLISIVKSRRLAEANVSTSDETETRKSSRSTSSLKNETELQPIKQSRGRSSSRIKPSDTPVFLHDPEIISGEKGYLSEILN